MATGPTQPHSNVDRFLLDQQELRAQFGVFRRQVEQLVSLTQTHQRQLSDLTVGLAAVRQQAEQAVQLEGTVRILQELADQLRTAQADLAARLERLERLHGTETDQLRQGLSALQRRLDELGAAADLARSRLDALAEAHRKQQEAVATITKNVENWAEEVGRIQGQLRTLPGLIHNLERDLAGLRPQVADLAAEHSTTANRLKAMAEDLGRLNDAVDGLRQDWALFDDARQTLRDLRTSFDVLERWTRGQEEALRGLTERIDRVELGQRDLAHHLRNLEAELSRARTQLEQALELNGRLIISTLGLLENLVNLRLQSLQGELRQIREFTIRAKETRPADEPP
ncbi:MAG: hypothetical protein C4315_12160 [Chloroflexota bacterium]